MGLISFRKAIAIVSLKTSGGLSLSEARGGKTNIVARKHSATIFNALEMLQLIAGLPQAA